MTNETKFWNWFEENNSRYFYLGQITDPNKREELLDEFLNHLHDYSNKLFFEIGGRPNETQELIITAAGNTDYYGQVEQLVSASPFIDGWNVIAFKPPMGIDFVTRYEDIELDPKRIWFLPLENKAD